MILEKGCAERGCACYDVRVDEGVEVKVVRELTDEEIMEEWNRLVGYHEEGNPLVFAKAVLKKASEK
jgi:hypothetical protein